MNYTHDSKFCTVDRVAHTLVLMNADGEILATHEIAQHKGDRRVGY